jgi:hypothetical protein
MPKFSGKDVITESTEKAITRAMVLAGAGILTKLYAVPLNDLKVLGMDLPASLVDATLLVLIGYTTYSFVLKWVGDLAAFRLWYRESSIWSQFGTNMKLDKEFLRGAVPLLERLNTLETTGDWPASGAAIDDETKKALKDFKTNAALYCLRLEYAGTRFNLLSLFGHYYVWIHSFAFPIALSVAAICLLVRHGTYVLPTLP